MAELERALPEDAIVVDESITATIELTRVLSFDGPATTSARAEAASARRCPAPSA